MSITAKQWAMDQPKFTLRTPSLTLPSAPQPQPTYMNELIPPDENTKYIYISAPARNRVFTDEELLAMPEVQRLQEAMISRPGSVKFRVIDGKLIRPPL